MNSLRKMASRLSLTSSQQSKTDEDVIDDAELPLEQKNYYHGFLTEADAQEILKYPGDFLVRKTEQKDILKTKLVVSVRVNDQTYCHLSLYPDRNGICSLDFMDEDDKVQRKSFKSVEAFIDYCRANPRMVIMDAPGAVLRYPVNRQIWEIERDDVQLFTKIYEGKLVEVWKGLLKATHNPIRYIPVAVKRTRPGLLITIEDREAMATEFRAMRDLVHPNIVRQRGIVYLDEPLMIITEYCAHGSLNQLLRIEGPAGNIDWYQRMKFCIDIAQGMRYLEKLKYIHRDVSTANVLVDFTKTAKLHEFGLSVVKKKLYKEENEMQLLPLKWLAPESITDRTYSIKSDVFSFGIFMWEVFENGAEPYPDWLAPFTMHMVKQGFRQQPPASMLDGAEAALMARCTEASPERRPSFLQIKLELRKIVEQRRQIDGEPKPATFGRRAWRHISNRF